MKYPLRVCRPEHCLRVFWSFVAGMALEERKMRCKMDRMVAAKDNIMPRMQRSFQAPSP